MRTPTGSFTIALLVSSACASSRTAAYRGLDVSRVVASPMESAILTESEQATVIVHIVNEAAQAYRVSIALDGVTRVLGSVSGLETRDSPSTEGRLPETRHASCSWRNEMVRTPETPNSFLSAERAASRGFSIPDCCTS